MTYLNKILMVLLIALAADSVETSGVLMGAYQSGTLAPILTSDYITSHSNSARRPPDGRENNELIHLKINSMGTKSESLSTTPVILNEPNLGSEAVQVQSAKEPSNAKINVQVTVLVGKSLLQPSMDVQDCFDFRCL